MHWDDRIYRMIMRHCAANIFYMPDPIPVWTRRGVPVETFFVAHNTVAITQTPYSPEGRKDFLFVGSLYAQKRVDLLIDAYHEALSSGGSPDGYPKLLIVGGGDEESNLMEKVRRDNLDGQVVFYHAVYDESALSRLFQRALLCISPHQAGLSVLKSFAYGTPFVTREDAITGGELFNIRNGENGMGEERLRAVPERLPEGGRKTVHDALHDGAEGISFRRSGFDFRGPEFIVRNFFPGAAQRLFPGNADGLCRGNGGRDKPDSAENSGGQ